MNLPRVLLVEDDAGIRKWVAMALEGEAVDLLACSSVDLALEALKAQPVQLLITDLMLPGRSGHELLADLARSPGLRAGACLVVFSAGLDALEQDRLRAQGVWRCLAKPASLAELLGCVHEGLAQTSGEAAPAVPAAAASPRAGGPAEGRGDPHRAQAIEHHFGGNEVLFAAFEADCQPALKGDLRSGTAALAAHDLQALHRLAHALISMLHMLGLPALAAGAKRLELQARAGDVPACRAAWLELQAGLEHWMAASMSTSLLNAADVPTAGASHNPA